MTDEPVTNPDELPGAIDRVEGCIWRLSYAIGDRGHQDLRETIRLARIGARMDRLANDDAAKILDSAELLAWTFDQAEIWNPSADTTRMNGPSVAHMIRSLAALAQAAQASNQFATDDASEAVDHELIERLLDAQQDINYAANCLMDQSLCDASALIDEIEPILRRALTQAGDARLRDALEQIRGVDDGAEISTLNYSHDAVERLNNAFIECVLIADRALTSPPSIGLAADEPEPQLSGELSDTASADHAAGSRSIEGSGAEVWPSGTIRPKYDDALPATPSPVAESKGGGVEDAAKMRARKAITDRYYAGGKIIQMTPVKPAEIVDIVIAAVQADPGQSGEEYVFIVTAAGSPSWDIHFNSRAEFEDFMKRRPKDLEITDIKELMVNTAESALAGAAEHLEETCGEGK